MSPMKRLFACLRYLGLTTIGHLFSELLDQSKSIKQKCYKLYEAVIPSFSSSTENPNSGESVREKDRQKLEIWEAGRVTSRNIYLKY